jgi:hypothetical protein
LTITIRSKISKLSTKGKKQNIKREIVTKKCEAKKNHNNLTNVHFLMWQKFVFPQKKKV